MQKNLKKSLLVIALLSTSGLAFSATTDNSAINLSNVSRYDGFFITAFGGPAFMPSTDEKDGTGDSITKYMKTGYGLGIGLGYKINMLRMELAASHLKSDIDKLKYHGVDVPDITGDTQVTPIMFNVYWDLDFLSARVNPYLGVGVGYMDFKEDIKSSSTNYEIKESGNTTAYQGVIGCMYHINESFALYADYRYFDSREKSYDVKDNNGNEGSWKVTYKNHLVNIGASYRFN